MILLCGIPSESPLQRVINAADERGVSYTVFNQRESVYSDVSLHLSKTGHDGRLRLREHETPVNSIVGAYVRLMDAGELPEHQPLRQRAGIDPRIIRAHVLHSTLHEWFEMSPARILNRPSCMASNMSKPYQAQWIRRSGFKVPPTIITNLPKLVRQFRKRHKRLIYKSISSARSIVQELTQTRMKDLDQIRDLPTQFQALIEGADLRVHTVGDRCFCTEIQSDVVDYRYAARDGKVPTLVSCDLPPSIIDRCLALSRVLGLPLSGIDLKRTNDGEYYCLEVNPSPAYTYYEDHTGQPIADAIVRYLVEGTARE